MSTAFETGPMLIHSKSNNFFTAFIRLYALEAAGICTFPCIQLKQTKKSTYSVEQSKYFIYIVIFLPFFPASRFMIAITRKTFFTHLLLFFFTISLLAINFGRIFYITFFCFSPKKYVLVSMILSRLMYLGRELKIKSLPLQR